MKVSNEKDLVIFKNHFSQDIYPDYYFHTEKYKTWNEFVQRYHEVKESRYDYTYKMSKSGWDENKCSNYLNQQEDFS